jgi:hypothetical protein
MIVSTITKSGVSLSEILSDKKLQFADLSKREHNELILKLEKLI